MLFLIFGCTKSHQPIHINIGFSQCTMADEWRVQMFEEMKRETFLIKGYDFKLEMKNAEKNITQQENDIREFVKKGVDVLIVSPYRSVPLKHIIDSVSALNIPVILIDRDLKTKEKVSYVGADNYQIGVEAGNEIIKLLPNGGKILSFLGLSGSRPAHQRRKGFLHKVKKHPKYLISEINCDWTEETAYKKMLNLIQANKSFDLIFSHNDFMSKGIIKAFLDSNNSLLPPIVSIDGLNIPNYGIDMVSDATLSATLTYPTGGDVAIQIAYQIITNKEVPRNTILNSVLINQSNVKAIKLQRNEIDNQIKKIDQQNQLIKVKNRDIALQKTRTKNLILIFLFGTIVLSILLYFFRKKNIKKDPEFQNSESEDETSVHILPNMKPDHKKFIKDIEQVIIDNILNKELNIQFLSDKMSMSHSTIYRKIKHTTGLSGVELINLVRLKQAEKLLKTTNLSIKEIAFRTGFSTASYFSRNYLKQFGISPSDSRENG